MNERIDAIRAELDELLRQELRAIGNRAKTDEINAKVFALRSEFISLSNQAFSKAA